MDAQTLRLDHFTIYDVPNQQAGQVVGLQGQFDEQPEKVQLTYLNAFGVPAAKNGEKVYDQNGHLSWYDLYDPVPDPVREVALENQFGKQTIITGRSVALLTPTQVAEPGSTFPENLDHFKVYQVLQGEPIDKQIKVEDHAGSYQTSVVYPSHFGVPVRKWADGQTFGIHNEKAHLLFYRIYPSQIEKQIRTRDQFGQRYLQLFHRVLLGVPSVKHDWRDYG